MSNLTFFHRLAARAARCPWGSDTVPSYDRSLVLLAFGIIVTVGTYLIAPGGYFVIAWGPTLWGLIYLVRTFRARQIWKSVERQGLSQAKVVQAF